MDKSTHEKLKEAVNDIFSKKSDSPSKDPTYRPSMEGFMLLLEGFKDRKIYTPMMDFPEDFSEKTRNYIRTFALVTEDMIQNFQHAMLTASPVSTVNVVSSCIVLRDFVADLAQVIAEHHLDNIPEPDKGQEGL